MSDEEDYDAFNNETFGDDVEEFDWEADHEHFSHIVELEKSKEISTDDLFDDSHGQDWDENNFANLLIPENISQYKQDEYVLFPSHEKNIPLHAFDQVYPNVLQNSLNDDSDDLIKLGEQMKKNSLFPDSCFISFSNSDSQWKQSPLVNNDQNAIDNLIHFNLPNEYNDEWLFKESHSTVDKLDVSTDNEIDEALSLQLLRSLPMGSSKITDTISNTFQSCHKEITPSVDDLLIFQEVSGCSDLDTVLQSPIASPVLHEQTSTSDKMLVPPLDDINDLIENKKDAGELNSKMKPYTALDAFFLFPPPQIYHPMGISRHLENMKSTVAENFSDYDDYAGLMTDREKYWLAGIQLLPVNGMDPYRDDYYFTMYQMRHSSRRKNTLVIKDYLRKNQTINKDYSPIQFENSLGKVQVGSTIAPRKVIDTYNIEYTTVNNCVNNDDDDENNKSLRKLKIVLLKIEGMYAKILNYEDLDFPVVKSKDQISEIDSEVNKSSNAKSLIADIYRELMASKNDFLTYMSIRKGKRLVLRFLPCCNNPFEIWVTIFEFFKEITLKDKKDGLLLFYLPHFRTWLNLVPLSLLIQMAEYLTYSIIIVFQDKFGVSILANMVEHAELIFDSAKKTEQIIWMNFINYVAQNLSSCSTVEKPVVCLKEQTLYSHMSKCKKLKNGYLTGLINLFTNASVK